MSAETPREPELPRPPSTAAVEAFCEYLRQLELEPELDWEAFCAGRRELAGELRRLLDEYERVAAILEALTPAASFSARLRAHYGDSIDPGISLSGEVRGGTERAPRSGGSSTQGSSGSSGVLGRLGGGGAADSSRYEARREIARGGMGAIHEVWDAELRRTLAMKVVLTDVGHSESDDGEGRLERRLSRFLEEAQITGQLDHPGIVPVHDIGIDPEGRVFFTMQLVDGLDLRRVFELARLEREGWSERRVVSVLIRVCEAMAYAHSKGVVHRDLKPANIMVGAFGEAFVMDWGLAKVMGGEAAKRESRERERDALEGARVVTDRSDSDTGTDAALLTMDGDVVGTPAYMAPEQARGRLDEVGPLSDIYAVGAMLYHLLSGHMPYEPLGEKVAAHVILEAVRKGPPWPLAQLNPEVDEELAAICEKAMSRDPQDRYGEMMELGEELRAWVEGRGVEAFTSGVLYETRKWMERNKATTVALFALIGLALVSVLLFIWQQQANVRKLKKEREATGLAIEERTRAEADLNLLVQDLREKEQKLGLEAARAQRASQEARAEEERSRRATERANESAERARQSEEAALAGAYRSHVSAASYSLRLAELDEARAHLEECPPALRGWEWDHLLLACDASVGAPLVLDQPITDLERSRDGSRLVSYAMSLPAHIWNSRDLSLVCEVEAVATVRPMAFGRRGAEPRCALSPDGGLVLLCNPVSSFAQLYNASEGNQLISLKPRDAERQVLAGVAVTPDGERAVTLSREGVGRVHPILGGEEILTFQLEGPDGASAARRQVASSLDVGPRGERALVGCFSGLAVVFSLENGEPLARLEGQHLGEVAAVEFSPDGRAALTASVDGTVGVWDAASGNLLAMMHGHLGPVHDATFARGGDWVVSAGEDMTLRAWEARSGRSRGVYHGHTGPVRAVVSLPAKGELISASMDQTLRRWELGWNPARTRVGASIGVTDATFAGGERRLLFTGRGGSAGSLDLDSGRVAALFDEAPAELPAELNRLACALSPDGELLALALGDRSLRVLERETGVARLVVEGLERAPIYLRFSADSRRLLAAGEGKLAYVHDLESGGEPVALGERQRGAARSLRGADLSSDGGFVATVDADGDLRLWDARTGARLAAQRNPHRGRLSAVAFSPDGELLVTGGRGGGLRVWKTEGLELLHVLEGHGAAVTCLAFHPDGSRLASGDAEGECRLWDVERGEGLLKLSAEESLVGLEFSPSGARLCGWGQGLGVVAWESGGADARHTHLTEERELRLAAERWVTEELARVGTPRRVARELELDPSLDPESRARSAEALARMRSRLDVCEEVVGGLLGLGPMEPELLEGASEWLSDLEPGHGEDGRWLALRAGLRLRRGDSEGACSEFAELREVRAPGARDLLLEGLGLARLGDLGQARHKLSEARVELAALSSERAHALDRLVDELRAAVDG